MPYDTRLREEELKNKIAQEYFWLYDNTQIIGDIDFCVAINQENHEFLEQESLLWAEAKKGISDIYKSLVQLVLTIGKARTFDKYLPPTFLGAFDAEKIAFIPYNDIHEVFYLNDFNWNVAPSQHDTKEFTLLYERIKAILAQNTLLFYYDRDDCEIKRFIKHNFVVSKAGVSKIKIDKNNFIVIYNKWLQTVKPTIAINWKMAKKKDVIDGDFYLADLLSKDNVTLKDKLFVVLNHNKYELNRHQNDYGVFTSSKVEFNDQQKAHKLFWNKYERPPREDYWDYIINRRDLLVPQDIRERKGSFFTPQIWVELSQQYLAQVLGENWQDEYYIWDCAAGTGNLLAGLTNKQNIWASTLDRQDVEVMKDRIRNGANLLETNVFQFDFLNDDFSKLPEPLQNIIKDADKRRRLIVYINPPYAEVSSVGKGRGKAGVNKSKIHEKYTEKLGTAGRELYTQFMTRVYVELEGCLLAEFSTQKTLQGAAFTNFRNFFQAQLKRCFVVPADTFDNVKGKFPIGFKIWDTSHKNKFEKIEADVYNHQGTLVGKKLFVSFEKEELINQWISQYKVVDNNYIGFLAGTNGNDFQHNNIVYILNRKAQMPNPRGIWISAKNILKVAIYFAVRHCIEATWLNDRDQFLYPNDGWKTDITFQNDCLAFTLFHGQNKVSIEQGDNHWIPFSPQELDAPGSFLSTFMSDFIRGKLPLQGNGSLLETEKNRTKPLVFSAEAKAVFEAGKALWRYHYSIPYCNVDAALYDIKAYFQGRDAKGKMNSRSTDETYTTLIQHLRNTLKILGNKIAIKVYEYGFLKA